MTKTVRLLFAGLVLTFALSWTLATSAQEGDQGPASPPSPEVAASFYRSRCANCHGAGGRGDGPQAVQADLPMPNLTDPALVRRTTPAQWFDVISNGVEGTAMPPFGEANSSPLRQIDRWNLVFYLYTLSTPPTQVAMGEALYTRSCTECHGVDGAGGTSEADFTDLAKMAVTSQIALFAAIADTTVEGHDLGMGEIEIWTLADYVRTFSYRYAPPSETAPPETSASTVASPFSGGDGVVSGRVVNGTAGATTPEGLEVQLRAFDMDANLLDAITTTTATDGSFRFENIALTLPVQMGPLAIYRNVPYFDDLDTTIMLSPEGPEADVNITVYETTEDPRAVRIEHLHILFEFGPGQTQVIELYILSNDGDRAYVGTLEEGTLQLAEPPNALSFQPAGDPGRYLALADGVADTIPVPPGQSVTESGLVYNLAYNGALELSRPMPYDARTVNIFVPEDVEVSGKGIERGSPFVAETSTFQTFFAEDLAAGEQLAFRVSGEPEVSSESALPSSHQTSTGPDETQSLIIGLVTLIGALVIAFLYWQGRLRLTPTAPDRQSALLQTIADLDDDWEAGRVKDEAYQAQRDELKQELIELMEKER